MIVEELNEEEDINFFIIIPIDNIFSPFSTSLSMRVH